MKKGDKAQSQIVSVVLIILLVLAAIIIIWTLIKGTVQEKSNEASDQIEAFRVQLDLVYVWIENGNDKNNPDDQIIFTIKRLPGKGDLKLIKMILFDENGNRYIYDEKGKDVNHLFPKELETKRYWYPVNYFKDSSGNSLDNFDNIVKAQIAWGIYGTSGRLVLREGKIIEGEDKLRLPSNNPNVRNSPSNGGSGTPDKPCNMDGNCDEGETINNCQVDCKGISDCLTITKPGTYVLAQDILATEEDSDCIVIESNDVTLKLNNHGISRINGEMHDGKGIYVKDSNNVEIIGSGKGISFFEYGIYLENSKVDLKSVQLFWNNNANGNGIYIKNSEGKMNYVSTQNNLVGVKVESIKNNGFEVSNSIFCGDTIPFECNQYLTDENNNICENGCGLTCTNCLSNNLPSDGVIKTSCSDSRTDLECDDFDYTTEDTCSNGVCVYTDINNPEDYYYCNGADINRDGKVNLADFILFKESFGITSCSVENYHCLYSDINLDNKVNLGDLVVFKQFFGREDCRTKEDKCYKANCDSDEIALCPNVGNAICIPNTNMTKCSNGNDLECDDFDYTTEDTCENGYCKFTDIQDPNNYYYCDGADINRDGKVNLAEMLLIKKFFEIDSCSLENHYCNLIDINKDGKVNFVESIKVKKYYGREDCRKEGSCNHNGLCEPIEDSYSCPDDCENTAN